MRRIYLIRHGKPDFPGDEKYCLGTTDMPIGALGRLQGCLLGAALGGRGLSVFSSPLSRAVQTAEYLSTAPTIIEGLHEMHAGDWDGLSFTQIREGWQALFQLRGEFPGAAIPGAEDMQAGQTRFTAAVLEALSRSEGDIAIVAHSTVNQCLICRALDVPVEKSRDYKLRYGSYSILEYDGAFHVLQTDILPHPELDRALCLRLLSAAGCGEGISAHCAAVAGQALRIASALNAAGLALDTALIESSALLHDIARREQDHARRGADRLDELGYPRQAELVRLHHDLRGTGINEAAVVYMADKCVEEDRPVPLRRRFAASREKCSSPEALAAHKTRYETALELMNKINSICEKEIIL